mgnify:CR=1 FL=1|tara:strand:+ start:96 stop:410 length:315 start_codon:yes stop_codon:yes gene_type:complete
MSKIKGVRNIINNVLDCSDRLGSYEIGELRTCISVLDKIIETKKEKDIRGVPLMMKIPVYYSWDDETSQYQTSFDCMNDMFSDEMKKLDTEMIVLSQEVNAKGE